MRLMLDFKCECCGKTVEKFVESTVNSIICECMNWAKRIIGMPTVKLDGTDPAFPTAYDKWATIREKNAQIRAQQRE